VLLLGGVAGYLDAVGYLTLGIFTANMTGNTVLLGMAIGQGHSPAMARVLVALAAFLAGAGTGAPLLRERQWIERVLGDEIVSVYCLKHTGGAEAHLGPVSKTILRDPATEWLKREWGTIAGGNGSPPAASVGSHLQYRPPPSISQLLDSARVLSAVYSDSRKG
jgi:hypothetical protein